MDKNITIEENNELSLEELERVNGGIIINPPKIVLLGTDLCLQDLLRDTF